MEGSLDYTHTSCDAQPRCQFYDIPKNLHDFGMVGIWYKDSMFTQVLQDKTTPFSWYALSRYACTHTTFHDTCSNRLCLILALIYFQNHVTLDFDLQQQDDRY